MDRLNHRGVPCNEQLAFCEQWGGMTFPGFGGLLLAGAGLEGSREVR